MEKKKCGNDCHGHGCGESVASGGGGGEMTIFFPTYVRSSIYTTVYYLAGDFLSEVGEVHLSGRLLLTAVTPVFHHCILCRAPSELWKFLTI